MTVRTLVPSLALLVSLPAAGSAVELLSGDISVDLSVRIQSRLEVISASDATGEDYDIWDGPVAAGEEAHNVNLMFRRARAWISGSYKDNTKFNLTFAADNTGARGQGLNDDQWEMLYGWVSHTMQTEAADHTLVFGKFVPAFTPTLYNSSGSLLFPTRRLSTTLSTPLSTMALEYRLGSEYVDAYAGVIEADEIGGDDGGDYWFYLRGETAFLPEYKAPKRTESFLGAEGMDWLVGAAVATRIDGDDEDEEITQFGLDGLFHRDALTASFDFIYRTADTGPDTDVTSMVIEAQGGYCFPLENDLLLEPALRLALVDQNDDDDDETTPYSRDGGASGMYITAGVNCYFDGHHHKLQAALTSFTPEDGDADAVIFRLQHQLSF